MSEKKPRLKKELGLLNVCTLATGTTLSAGLFLLPGIAARDAGPAVILAYMIAAIPMIPAMFSIIELSTAMPRAGGAYYFLDRSMGPLVGTVGGIGTWLALVLKTSFALIGMGAYLAIFIDNVPVRPLAVALAVFFGIVNLAGSKKAGGIQLFLVGGLLSLLGWFMTGIVQVKPVNFEGFFDKGWEPIFATAGLVYISYVGITNLASVSEEIKDPERNLPRGVIIAFIISFVVYSVGTTVMVGVLGVERLATGGPNGTPDLHPVATAAEVLFGRSGKIAIVIAATCAFASVANAGILSASRYPLAMSRDHLIPRVFARLSKKNIPVVGVLVTVSMMIVLIALFPVAQIAKLASAFQLVVFALICLAVIVMRESGLASYDPGFKSPFYPWMQVVGVLAPIGLLGTMDWLPKLFSLLLLAVCAWWYFFYASKRIVRDGAIYHMFERLGRRRYEGLDSELRGIMKEKGLRKEDPFDEVVARAFVLDLEEPLEFLEVATLASNLLDSRVPETPAHMAEGFHRGTRIGATPVSHGAALPHLRIPGMEQPELVIVRTRADLTVEVLDEFGEASVLDEPIHALFFLVSPADTPGQHLRILAQIAGHVDDENFMKNWMAAGNEQELKETLLRDECHLSVLLTPDLPSKTLISKSLRQLHFPQGCLVALVRRKDHIFVPGANTTLLEGDRLTVIGDADGIAELYAEYVKGFA